MLTIFLSTTPFFLQSSYSLRQIKGEPTNRIFNKPLVLGKPAESFKGGEEHEDSAEDPPGSILISQVAMLI